jgi:hypothetical protein
MDECGYHWGFQEIEVSGGGAERYPNVYVVDRCFSYIELVV